MKSDRVLVRQYFVLKGEDGYYAASDLAASVTQRSEAFHFKSKGFDELSAPLRWVTVNVYKRKKKRMTYGELADALATKQHIVGENASGMWYRHGMSQLALAHDPANAVPKRVIDWLRSTGMEIPE